jgi:hypothetical protein
MTARPSRDPVGFAPRPTRRRAPCSTPLARSFAVSAALAGPSAVHGGSRIRRRVSGPGRLSALPGQQSVLAAPSHRREQGTLSGRCLNVIEEGTDAAASLRALSRSTWFSRAGQCRRHPRTGPRDLESLADTKRGSTGCAALQRNYVELWARGGAERPSTPETRPRPCVSRLSRLRITNSTPHKAAIPPAPARRRGDGVGGLRA